MIQGNFHAAFHAAGFRVFPLHGADIDGEPCDIPYKQPRSAGWQKTPIWSQEQFDLMQETGQFDTGYGVLCHGLIVVDVDARNGGLASLEKLPVDLDTAGLIVATGSGGGSRHFYFRAPENMSLVQHLKEYPGIDFKCSGFVVGPGSMHQSGNHYTIIEGNIDDIDDAPADLVDMLRRPEHHRTEYNGAPMDVSHEDIAGMLAFIDPDCDHETWVSCGMAIHDASGGTLFQAWDEWSAKGAKYPGAQTLEKRWHSFGKSPNPCTIGTLIYHAEQGGWRQSVEFEHDPQVFATVSPADLLDTSHVDLLRPPGFVGEVCEWINGQCLYPREHLAVLASLISVGNLAGLRWKDDISGVTTNLFGFAVAASATGKDSVFKAFNEIHRVAGITGALHGMQKSEQEVIRNLVRHQAAFYNVDEFGIHLQKIINAGKRGSASYLEGLIGVLMNVYSKADSFFPISGDMKESIKVEILREIAKAQKAIDENEDQDGRHARALERATAALASVDNGIDRPFVSIIGTTTGSTFDDLVTPDQAKSGFIGRSLIAREYDDNPQMKEKFKKAKMPESLDRKIRALAIGDEYQIGADRRVEYYGERKSVKTVAEAKEALEQVSDRFWNYAEDQKEQTDLTPIPRRGYEMVSKVSTILAVQTGVRTLEHVQWAYALVARDVDTKLKMVVSNDNTYGADRVLMAKIAKTISTDHGETFGVICGKLRKYKKDDVRKALEIMKSGSVVKVEEYKHKSNGRTVERFFMV